MRFCIFYMQEICKRKAEILYILRLEVANVQDVANFFIEIGQAQAENGSGDPVTPMQLEKLLYFAQVAPCEIWHAAL